MINEELQAVMNAARVPYRYWDMKLTDIDGTERARAYLIDSGPLKDDWSSGRGAVFYGPVRIMNNVIPLVARGIAMRGLHVLYADLNDIIEDREDGDSERKLYSDAYDVEGLVIDQFYETGIDCPYTTRERRIIESLIRTRINEGKNTFFGSSSHILEAHWWSESIRNLIDETNREISI